MDITHRHRRDGRLSRGIQLVGEIIQQTVIFQQILCGFSRHRDLIGQSPYDDTRMIIILYDQLLHLRNSILPSPLHVVGNLWNLCPDHHSFFITQIIKIRIMLIMRQADRIGSHFTDQLHILSMMFRKQGISNPPAVLMS